MVNQIARYIYFVKPEGMDGPIKIGCSNKPARRLASFGPHNPYPLEIIAVAPGDMSTERAIHEHYAEELWHHEWFHASPRLIAATTALKRGASLAQAMPMLFG